MARFLKFRKSAVLPDRAPGGQVRLYLKPDETLETVDDEGNRAPVGDGGGGGAPDAHASTHENGGSDEIDVTGLTGAGGGGAILTATVDLDAADIATLSSVPVQVVAAPGAGKVIVPVSAVFQYKAGAVAFDNGDIVNLGNPAIFWLASGTVPFNDVNSTVAPLTPVSEQAAEQPGAENEALTLFTDSMDPDGEGDGTGRITVAYYVMDLLV